MKAPTALLICLALGAPSFARAATFTVDSTLDAVDAAPGDGACATAATTCTLRAAVQEAAAKGDADEIVLPAGTITLSIAGKLENAAATGDLDLRGVLLLRGAGVTQTFIDGAALDRVIDTVSPQAGETSQLELRDLTLRNGLLDGPASDHAGQGAGLRVSAGVNITLTDVDLRANRLTAFGGGGALDNSGCFNGTRVRMIDNGDLRPIGNGHLDAGAIVIRGGATTCMTLTDFEIANNRGDQAGALYASEHAPAIFRRGLIAGNSARFAGAALLNQDNEVLMENVTLTANAGGSGATLNDGGSRLRLINCTVTANTGTPNSPVPTIGGLGDVHGGNGLTFLTNTLVAGNGPGFIADDCDHATSVGGGNIVGSMRGCTLALAAGDQLNVAVNLGALADNGGFSRSHLPDATAIDHGRDADCLAQDQRGQPRPRDGDGDGQAHCDVGAVEVAGDAEGVFANGFEDAAGR